MKMIKRAKTTVYNSRNRIDISNKMYNSIFKEFKNSKSSKIRNSIFTKIRFTITTILIIITTTTINQFCPKKILKETQGKEIEKKSVK